jgi:dephospho-CoA kinase
VFVVALTGGIASGKSTVARYFSELGVNVIDADQIARKLVAVPEILQRLVDYFGQSILTKDKQLDRAQLREVVFFNTKARDWLEQTLHPLIYKEIQSSIQIAKSAYCLVVIPLLLEERTAILLKEITSSNENSYFELNRILLVATSKRLQVQRAKERDHLEENQIQAILSAQISPSESVNKVDDIICNETSLNDLRQSVARLHAMYLSFSQAKNIVLEQTAFLRYYLTIK